MNSHTPPDKRRLIMIVSAIEMVIAAAILLIVSGLLPIDISGLNIPRGTVAVVAGLWFVSSAGILIYMSNQKDMSE